MKPKQKFCLGFFLLAFEKMSCRIQVFTYHGKCTFFSAENFAKIKSAEDGRKIKS